MCSLKRHVDDVYLTKCYYQSDRMDSGIISWFRSKKTNLWERRYQTNTPGSPGWVYHFSRYHIIDLFLCKTWISVYLLLSSCNKIKPGRSHSLLSRLLPLPLVTSAPSIKNGFLNWCFAGKRCCTALLHASTLSIIKLHQCEVCSYKEVVGLATRQPPAKTDAEKWSRMRSRRPKYTKWQKVNHALAFNAWQTHVRVCSSFLCVVIIEWRSYLPFRLDIIGLSICDFVFYILTNKTKYLQR